MDTLLKIRDETAEYCVISVYNSIMEINDINLIKKEVLKKNTGIANLIVALAYRYITDDEFAYEFFLKESAKKNNLHSIKYLICFYNDLGNDEEEEKYKKMYNNLQSKKNIAKIAF